MKTFFLKLNVAVILLALISLNYAQDNWIYIKEVKYAANHDPDMISLVSGLKLQVEYDGISWKEVNAWQSGHALQLAYSSERGLVLIDKISNRAISVVSYPSEHPLYMIQTECEKKNNSTRGIVNCCNTSLDLWDKELNRVYKKLMQTLGEEQKETIRISQRKWIEFRDAQIASIREIYNKKEGSIWQIIISKRIVDLTRAQTKRLASYLSW